eukprot:s4251_g2.t1
MSQYIRQIKIEPLQGNGDLGPREVTLYRQLVMRLRWPAQQVMPHLLYQVSNLAQRVNKATYADYREAVKLHSQFLDEAAQGRAQLVYPKLNEKDKLFYVSFFDASERALEDHRRKLRQGQRQRRKAKMKGCAPVPAAPGRNLPAHQHTFLAM